MSAHTENVRKEFRAKHIRPGMSKAEYHKAAYWRPAKSKASGAKRGKASGAKRDKMGRFVITVANPCHTRRRRTGR